MEEESCSHTPPGANTPGLPPMENEAALSYTPHKQREGTRVAAQIKYTEKHENKWAVKVKKREASTPAQ